MPDDYWSPFEDWDVRSWVRSKAHQLEPFEPGLGFFSERFSPLLFHESVCSVSADVRRQLLGYQLQMYLDFTVSLEIGLVNNVCNLIRQPGFLTWLPERMKDDSLRVYVDEGGHAEMSQLLRGSALKNLGLPPLALEPAFIRKLDALIRREGAFWSPLIKLFFVIVSETLITGTLTKIPADNTVQPAVRSLVRDHAADEARHHAYFRALFERVWPRLPTAHQRQLGGLLPDMIIAFLSPDQEALTSVLRAFPQAFPNPARIAAEVTNLPAVRDGIRMAARPTIQMLNANGVFRDEYISSCFAQNKLRD